MPITLKAVHQSGIEALQKGKFGFYQGPSQIWQRQCILGFEFDLRSLQQLQQQVTVNLMTMERSCEGRLLLYGRDLPVHCSALVLEVPEGTNAELWREFCLKLRANPILLSLREKAERKLHLLFSQLVMTSDCIILGEEQAVEDIEDFRAEATQMIERVQVDFEHKNQTSLKLQYKRPPWAHISLARPLSFGNAEVEEVLQDIQSIKGAFETVSGPVVMKVHSAFVRNCAEYLGI